MRNLIKKILNESVEEEDVWKWVRDIKPEISFEEAQIGDMYKIKTDEMLLNAINACGEWVGMYYDSVEVEVESKDYIKYSDVYCGSENYDEVISLHLMFYDENGHGFSSFWVTEDMVKLYPISDSINESTDEFDWFNNENSLDGVKVVTPMGGELTIVDNGGKYVEVTWDIEGSEVISKGKGSAKYNRKSVEAMISDGTWKLKDEWDWIRESNPLSSEDLSGKALYFNPPIDNKADLLKILNYLSNFGFQYGDWYDTLEWDEEGILGIYIDPKTDRLVYTTDFIDDEYQGHINDFANRAVEVLDGWNFWDSYII